MLAVDFTITIGNIIEIVSIVGGGVVVLLTLKSDVKSLQIGAKALKDELNGMQAEIKRLGDILIDLAKVQGDIKLLDQRITSAEQDIRELRHGDGFIVKRP